MKLLARIRVARRHGSDQELEQTLRQFRSDINRRRCRRYAACRRADRGARVDATSRNFSAWRGWAAWTYRLCMSPGFFGPRDFCQLSKVARDVCVPMGLIACPEAEFCSLPLKSIKKDHAMPRCAAGRPILPFRGSSLRVENMNMCVVEALRHKTASNMRRVIRLHILEGL